MDLLRLIWARLPLEGLRILGRDFDTTDLVRERLRIQRLEEYAVATVKGRFSKSPYLALAVYRGGLMKGAEIFVDPAVLCSRAAFLQEAEWYHYYAEKSSIFSIDVDAALISDIPEIQARALSMTNDRFDVTDPGLINWRSGLVVLYHDMFSTTSQLLSKQEIFLAGYLHVPISVWMMRNPDSYIVGYIQSEMIGKDPFQKSASIEELFHRFGIESPESDRYILNSIKGGYFPPSLVKKHIDYVAVEYIQPRLLERLIEASNVGKSKVLAKRQFQKIRFDAEEPITYDLALRARQMAVLLRGRPEWTFERIYMEALGGLLIDMAELNQIPTWARNTIQEVMEAVAHPQFRTAVRTDLMPGRGSSVYYDPIGYAQRQSVAPRWKILSRIYQSGMLLEAARPENLVNYVYALNNNPGIGSLTSFNSDYENILRVLKDG